MMTHASTTLPSRTSFSVHVEMYSVGSAGRWSRSCVTSSGRRAGAAKPGGELRVAGSPAPVGREAHDDPDHREDEADEPEEPDDLEDLRAEGARVEHAHGEERAEGREQDVHDEEREAHRREADPCDRAPVAVLRPRDPADDRLGRGPCGDGGLDSNRG